MCVYVYVCVCVRVRVRARACVCVYVQGRLNNLKREGRAEQFLYVPPTFYRRVQQSFNCTPFFL